VIRVLIPIIFLVWLIDSLLKKKIALDRRWRFWLLNFILILSFCSIFWASNQEKALRKVLFLTSVFPIYWFFFPFLRKKANLQLFLKTFFITTFISALIGFFQFLSQFIFGLNPTLKFQHQITPFFLGNNFSEMVLTYNSWLVNIGGQTIFRAIGLFPDPHLFSLFLNISLPVGFYLYHQTKNSYYLLATGIILSTSLLTFSRAGYLSLLIVFVLIWIKLISQKKTNSFSQKPFLKLFEIKNFVLVIILLLFLIIPNPINQRLFSIINFQDNSVNERIDLLQDGIEITRNNFWGGVGIGNLSETVQPGSDLRTPIYAHNLFLDFSTELGFLGGLMIFLIIIAPIKNYFKKNSPKKLMLASIFIIILVHSLFETPFYSVHLLPLILTFLAI
jgi:O-antigen ligase